MSWPWTQLLVGRIHYWRLQSTVCGVRKRGIGWSHSVAFSPWGFLIPPNHVPLVDVGKYYRFFILIFPYLLLIHRKWGCKPSHIDITGLLIHQHHVCLLLFVCWIYLICFAFQTSQISNHLFLPTLDSLPIITCLISVCLSISLSFMNFLWVLSYLDFSR